MVKNRSVISSLLVKHFPIFWHELACVLSLSTIVGKLEQYNKHWFLSVEAWSEIHIKISIIYKKKKTSALKCLHRNLHCSLGNTYTAGGKIPKQFL